MRAEIGRIPDGVYQAERQIDNDGIDFGQPVTIRTKIEVRGDEIVFDYSASDPQVAGYVNSPFPNTASATYLTVYSLVDANIRQNAGAMRPITCIVPEGNVLNPRDPAPSTACTVLTVEAIMEAAWLALAQAIPERVQASWARWCGPATAGFNPRTGRAFGEIHFMSKGGGGATQGFDGWDHIGTVICLGGLRSPDPELHELVNPISSRSSSSCLTAPGPVNGAAVWASSTAGAWMPTTYCAPTLAVAPRPPPRRLACTGAALVRVTRNSCTKSRATFSEVTINSVMSLNKGQKIEIYSGGGGGYGDPLARDVDKVAADVRDGLVSVDSAREDYGVMIDPISFAVDVQATNKLRTPTD